MFKTTRVIAAASAMFALLGVAHIAPAGASTTTSSSILEAFSPHAGYCAVPNYSSDDQTAVVGTNAPELGLNSLPYGTTVFALARISLSADGGKTWSGYWATDQYGHYQWLRGKADGGVVWYNAYDGTYENGRYWSVPANRLVKIGWYLYDPQNSNPTAGVFASKFLWSKFPESGYGIYWSGSTWTDTCDTTPAGGVVVIGG